MRLQSLKPPSSTPEGDRHVRPLTFVYGIKCSTTVISRVFSHNLYFWQRWAPNWIYFSISVQCNILNMHLGFYTPWVLVWFWKYRYYIDNIDIDFKKHRYYRCQISCKNNTTNMEHKRNNHYTLFTIYCKFVYVLCS